ncbi:toprim domain-containing protein [Hyphomonadaceae bacterium BL14]|nr:toprim domain-containing protein [Hyphomonadaceae bacterium BL14]
MSPNWTTTGAQELTAALGGRWAGRYGVAACPVCQPERRRDQRALVLADGRAGLLLDCKKSSCGFADILAAAGLRAKSFTPPDLAEAARREVETRADTQRKSEAAWRLWWKAQPIEGTLAETYLRSRGITCPLPLSLRFHPDCWHAPSDRCWPAMVALVEGGEGFAIHRTWIRPDGSGKADIDPAKAMLGRCSGGAVRLAEGHGRLVVAEGLESALSLLCGLLDAPTAMWAGLSTSGLRALRLPIQPGRLTIACDGDTPGRTAAHALAERAHAQGWAVTIADPGDGADFNDILNGKAVLA